MEEFVTNAGDKLTVHSLGDCRGPVCPVHKPTPHHMREWPMIWRGDRRIFERVCEHGIGHPDPDDQEAKLFIQGFMDGVHGCDGCCMRPRVGDRVRANGFYDPDRMHEGVLHHNIRETVEPPEHFYYVVDNRGENHRIVFKTAYVVTNHEYTMVDLDPELR
jgi:hypothetical protein